MGVTTLNFITQKTERLDEFLRREMPVRLNDEAEGDFSNSKIRRLVVAGCVEVNGRTVNRAAFELRGRSEIKIRFDKEKFFYEKQPDDIKFEVTPRDVLFEDENLIFINKPPFFPVEQTITGNRDNLHDAVVRYLWAKNPGLRNPPYVGIMHRLDRETSGVILFTKNRTVNKAVSDMFQNHDFIKRYVAVVEKKENKKIQVGDSFSVEMMMGRVSGKSKQGKWGSVPEKNGGQYSKTEFTVREEIIIENKQCLLVDCLLYTGRTHQIRVHLASVGLPILGDSLYGGKEAKRIYLHASELTSSLQNLSFSVQAPINFLQK